MEKFLTAKPDPNSPQPLSTPINSGGDSRISLAIIIPTALVATALVSGGVFLYNRNRFTQPNAVAPDRPPPTDLEARGARSLSDVVRVAVTSNEREGAVI